jgi:hypothetical protein
LLARYQRVLFPAGIRTIIEPSAAYLAAERSRFRYIGTANRIFMQFACGWRRAGRWTWRTIRLRLSGLLLKCRRGRIGNPFEDAGKHRARYIGNDDRNQELNQRANHGGKTTFRGHFLQSAPEIASYYFFFRVVGAFGLWMLV